MTKRSKKLRGKNRRMRNLEAHIPKGHYCYGYREDGKWVHPCPFLRFNKHEHHQSNGICEAFELRDDHNGGLLWDWVKECSVNDEYDENFNK
ncbi:hypothetical protein FZC83_02100 [Rossellomorea marisflavi]|uniref:Uncharacterized protein n=1 Tax=Rossellomorea marisflavi TaxID=189381 RepID=A0A5D4S2K0_9BACI|nr:hypothetical protein [Rossellomorea marisflavi]TYS56388.1 hypothetical protein FZC83_02100 [Rossellomorea marisflavi]